MDTVVIAFIFKFLIGHALADFVFQPTAMAKGKVRNKNNNSMSGRNEPVIPWPYWLTAHALVHAGVVWLITGSLLLGGVEVVLHWLIDFAKNENWTNIHIDQILHIFCKATYLIFI